MSDPKVPPPLKVWPFLLLNKKKGNFMADKMIAPEKKKKRSLLKCGLFQLIKDREEKQMTAADKWRKYKAPY